MFRCALHFGDVADPVERDLHVRSTSRGGAAILAGTLSGPEGAARAPRERVALPECIEDLAAHPSCGVGAERGAAVAAVPMGRLHQADETPGDEILAIRATTAGINGSGGDGSCELEMVDDARLDGSRRHRVSLRRG